MDRVRAGPKIGEGGRLAEKSYERVAESVSIPLDFYPLCEFIFQSSLFDASAIVRGVFEADFSPLPFVPFCLQRS